MTRAAGTTRLCACAVLLASGAALGGELPDHVNGPLTGIFGFPDSTDGGGLGAARTQGVTLSLATASHNIDKQAGQEVLRLDGETTRLALRWNYTLTDRLETGIEIPYLWHESGGLDGLIDSWHDFFGLPQGPRSRRAGDQLDFYYTDGAGHTLARNENTRGLGDVRLLAGWRLNNGDRHRVALRASVKLPTGDSDKLTGSGAADVSVGLAGNVTGLWNIDALDGYWQANVTRLGAADIPGAVSKEVAGQFATGLGYRLGRRLDLHAQLRLRTAVYDSEIDTLGEMSVVLTTGAEIRVTDRYGVFLAVGEDVKPDSAPDVQFLMGFRMLGRQGTSPVHGLR